MNIVSASDNLDFFIASNPAEPALAKNLAPISCSITSRECILSLTVLLSALFVDMAISLKDYHILQKCGTFLEFGTIISLDQHSRIRVQLSQLYCSLVGSSSDLTAEIVLIIRVLINCNVWKATGV